MGKESGFVVINVDHKLVSSIGIDIYDFLDESELTFVLWYQREIYRGLFPPVSFLVNPSVADIYDQEKVCKEILDFINSPTLDDPDLF